MSFRRIAQSTAAALLAVGVMTVGVAPAGAATISKVGGGAHTSDTAWD